MLLFLSHLIRLHVLLQAMAFERTKMLGMPKRNNKKAAPIQEGEEVESITAVAEEPPVDLPGPRTGGGPGYDLDGASGAAAYSSRRRSVTL